ncbi:DnaJ domain-containing protein [Limimonas halophila]|uniref:DnaJ domain-containing protein n=1 Tax=Limimonas halophila TaxID=1082479 RepID=A0A1G7RCZ9_9PROT|nr:J domain-containing protein [Limimonas halophila]SDG08647.1 DnaJ domain-containing protein [Limimonas halophila]
MKKAAAEALSRPFRDSRAYARSEPRACDQPGCEGVGEYRAPRSRERLNEYYWFCLDHVRAYNRSWNYFAGMSEEEIERERERDCTGSRPTWPFASLGRGGPRYGTRGFRDDFGFFHEERGDEDGARAHWQEERGSGTGSKRRARTPEDEALAELDLQRPVTFADIKARYKALVKRLHPDATGNRDEAQQDKLKAVNQAYATLRTAWGR